MLRDLYSWTLAKAEHPQALWVLAAVAFIESSVFPIPPDVLMIPMILARPRRAWLIALVATAASVLGGVLGYGIGYFVVSIVAEIILGFLASMIVFKFSRWREYRADAAGARLAGRGDMIAALERLRGNQAMAQDLPGELTAFGISEQLKQGIGALFSSHPPLEQRIAALRAGA